MSDFNRIFVSDEKESTQSISTEQEDADGDRDRDLDPDRDDVDALAADIAERTGLDEEEVKKVLAFLATDGESVDPEGPAGLSQEARSRRPLRDQAKEWAGRFGAGE